MLQKTSSVVFMLTLLCWSGSAVRQYHNYHVINESISWHEAKLNDYPALRLEICINFTFPQELCCPIVHIFQDLPNRVQDFYLERSNCVGNKTNEGLVYWFKGSTFQLPNNTQADGNCRLQQGIFSCSIYGTL